MTTTVTFDTNVLDFACRPERFPKDHRQPDMFKVKKALEDGAITGFYSVTMLTIEGMMKKDRAATMGSTRIAFGKETVSTQIIDGKETEVINMNLRVEQPGRQPLHPEVAARARAAKALDVRALKAPPRIGSFKIDDPTGEFFAPVGTGDELGQWIQKVQSVSKAIEDRGLGMAQVKSLGNGMQTNGQETWFRSLVNTNDIHKQRAVERSFSEWADGDSLAAHVAYGIDIFCSEDVGNSNATNSILDATNRAWLTTEYGVRFMTFAQLAATLP